MNGDDDGSEDQEYNGRRGEKVDDGPRRESKDESYPSPSNEERGEKRPASDNGNEHNDDRDDMPPEKQARREETDDEAKVYIGNLNFQTDRDFIEKELGKYGHVVDVFLPLDEAGRKRGFAFVTFEEKHSAQQCAEEMDDTDFDGRRIRCNIARPRPKSTSRREPSRSRPPPSSSSPPRPRESRRPRGGRIFVNGLPDDIRERELDDLYYRCGRIEYIEIHRSRSSGRVEAIVAFEDLRDAEYACRQTDGMRFEKQRLRVDLDR